MTYPLVFLSFEVTFPSLLNYNTAFLHFHVLLSNKKTANNSLDQDGALSE